MTPQGAKSVSIHSHVSPAHASFAAKHATPTSITHPHSASAKKVARGPAAPHPTSATHSTPLRQVASTRFVGGRSSLSHHTSVCADRSDSPLHIHAAQLA